MIQKLGNSKIKKAKIADLDEGNGHKDSENRGENHHFNLNSVRKKYFWKE